MPSPNFLFQMHLISSGNDDMKSYTSSAIRMIISVRPVVDNKYHGTDKVMRILGNG